MLGTRRMGGDHIIIDVRKGFCACSWVRGKLMNGCKRNLRIVCNDCFRAISMVRVKIPNCDTFRATLDCVQRSNSNVIEIAESHGAVARSMMPRWTH